MEKRVQTHLRSVRSSFPDAGHVDEGILWIAPKVETSWQDVVLNIPTGVFVTVGLACGLVVSAFITVCLLCCYNQKLRRIEEDKLMQVAAEKCASPPKSSSKTLVFQNQYRYTTQCKKPGSVTTDRTQNSSMTPEVTESEVVYQCKVYQLPGERDSSKGPQFQQRGGREGRELSAEAGGFPCPPTFGSGECWPYNAEAAEHAVPCHQHSRQEERSLAPDVHYPLCPLPAEQCSFHQTSRSTQHSSAQPALQHLRLTVPVPPPPPPPLPPPPPPPRLLPLPPQPSATDLVPCAAYSQHPPVAAGVSHVSEGSHGSCRHADHLAKSESTTVLRSSSRSSKSRLSLPPREESEPHMVSVSEADIHTLQTFEPHQERWCGGMQAGPWIVHSCSSFLVSSDQSRCSIVGRVDSKGRVHYLHVQPVRADMAHTPVRSVPQDTGQGVAGTARGTSQDRTGRAREELHSLSSSVQVEAVDGARPLPQNSATTHGSGQGDVCRHDYGFHLKDNRVQTTDLCSRQHQHSSGNEDGMTAAESMYDHLECFHTDINKHNLSANVKRTSRSLLDAVHQRKTVQHQQRSTAAETESSEQCSLPETMSAEDATPEEFLVSLCEHQEADPGSEPSLTAWRKQHRTKPTGSSEEQYTGRFDQPSEQSRAFYGKCSAQCNSAQHTPSTDSSTSTDRHGGQSARRPTSSLDLPEMNFSQVGDMHQFAGTGIPVCKYSEHKHMARSPSCQACSSAHYPVSQSSSTSTQGSSCLQVHVPYQYNQTEQHAKDISYGGSCADMTNPSMSILSAASSATDPNVGVSVCKGRSAGSQKDEEGNPMSIAASAQTGSGSSNSDATLPFSQACFCVDCPHVKPPHTCSSQLSCHSQHLNNSVPYNEMNDETSPYAYEVSLGGLQTFSFPKNCCVEDIPTTDSRHSHMETTVNNSSKAPRNAGTSSVFETSQMTALKEDSFIHSLRDHRTFRGNSTRSNIWRTTADGSAALFGDHDSLQSIQTENPISDSLTVHVANSRLDHSTSGDKVHKKERLHTQQQRTLSSVKSHYKGIETEEDVSPYDQRSAKRIKQQNQSPDERKRKRSMGRQKGKKKSVDWRKGCQRNLNKEKDISHNMTNNPEVSTCENTDLNQLHSKHRRKYYKRYIQHLKRHSQASLNPTSTKKDTKNASLHDKKKTSKSHQSESEKVCAHEQHRALRRSSTKRPSGLQTNRDRSPREQTQRSELAQRYDRLPFPRYPYCLYSSPPPAPKEPDSRRSLRKEEGRGRHTMDQRTRTEHSSRNDEGPHSSADTTVPDVGNDSLSPPPEKGRVAESLVAPCRPLQERAHRLDQTVSGLRMAYMDRSQFHRTSPPPKPLTPSPCSSFHNNQTSKSNKDLPVYTSKYSSGNLYKANRKDLRETLGVPTKTFYQRPKSDDCLYSARPGEKVLLNGYVFSEKAAPPQNIEFHICKERISKARKRYSKPAKIHSKLPFPKYPYYLSSSSLSPTGKEKRTEVPSTQQDKTWISPTYGFQIVSPVRTTSKHQRQKSLKESRDNQSERKYKLSAEKNVSFVSRYHGRKETAYPKRSRSKPGQPAMVSCSRYSASPSPSPERQKELKKDTTGWDFYSKLRPEVPVSELCRKFNSQSNKYKFRIIPSPGMPHCSPSPPSSTSPPKKRSAYGAHPLPLSKGSAVSDTSLEKKKKVSRLRDYFSMLYKKRKQKMSRDGYFTTPDDQCPDSEEDVSPTCPALQLRHKPTLRGTVPKLRKLFSNHAWKAKELPVPDYPYYPRSPPPPATHSQSRILGGSTSTPAHRTPGDSSYDCLQELTTQSKTSMYTKQLMLGMQKSNNSIGYIDPNLIRNYYPISLPTRHSGGKVCHKVPFHHGICFPSRDVDVISQSHTMYNDVQQTQPYDLTLQRSLPSFSSGYLTDYGLSFKQSNPALMSASTDGSHHVSSAMHSPTKLVSDKRRAAKAYTSSSHGGVADSKLPFPRYPYFPCRTPPALINRAWSSLERDSVSPPRKRVASLRKKYMKKTADLVRQRIRSRYPTHSSGTHALQKQSHVPSQHNLLHEEADDDTDVSRHDTFVNPKSPLPSKDHVAHLRRELLKQGVRLTGRFAPFPVDISHRAGRASRSKHYTSWDRLNPEPTSSDEIRQRDLRRYSRESDRRHFIRASLTATEKADDEWKPASSRRHSAHQQPEFHHKSFMEQGGDFHKCDDKIYMLSGEVTVSPKQGSRTRAEQSGEQFADQMADHISGHSLEREDHLYALHHEGRKDSSGSRRHSRSKAHSLQVAPGKISDDDVPSHSLHRDIPDMEEDPLVRSLSNRGLRTHASAELSQTADQNLVVRKHSESDWHSDEGGSGHLQNQLMEGETGTALDHGFHKRKFSVKDGTIDNGLHKRNVSAQDDVCDQLSTGGSASAVIRLDGELEVPKRHSVITRGDAEHSDDHRRKSSASRRHSGENKAVALLHTPREESDHELDDASAPEDGEEEAGHIRKLSVRKTSSVSRRHSGAEPKLLESPEDGAEHQDQVTSNVSSRRKSSASPKEGKVSDKNGTRKESFASRRHSGAIPGGSKNAEDGFEHKNQDTSRISTRKKSSVSHQEGHMRKESFASRRHSGAIPGGLGSDEDGLNHDGQDTSNIYTRRKSSVPHQKGQMRKESFVSRRHSHLVPRGSKNAEDGFEHHAQDAGHTSTRRKSSVSHQEGQVSDKHGLRKESFASRRHSGAVPCGLEGDKDRLNHDGHDTSKMSTRRKSSVPHQEGHMRKESFASRRHSHHLAGGSKNAEDGFEHHAQDAGQTATRRKSSVSHKEGQVNVKNGTRKESFASRRHSGAVPCGLQSDKDRLNHDAHDTSKISTRRKSSVPHQEGHMRKESFASRRHSHLVPRGSKNAEDGFRHHAQDAGHTSTRRKSSVSHQKGQMNHKASTRQEESSASGSHSSDSDVFSARI